MHCAEIIIPGGKLKVVSSVTCPDWFFVKYLSFSEKEGRGDGGLRTH